MIELFIKILDAILINKLYSILVSLIMVWIGYRLYASKTTKDRRVQDFNTAADKFCQAFAPELAALKMPSLDENSDPHAILQPTINKHRTPVIEFKRFLGCIRKRHFDHAWYEYYTYDDTGEETTDYLLKYSPGWEGKPIRECRNLAIANIEKLLEFAKHK